MPFQVGTLTIPQNFSDAYRFRREIEFVLLSEYKKYCVNPDFARQALLVYLATYLDAMPTNGAFPSQALDKLCAELGVVRHHSVPPQSLDACFKFLKVYPFQVRAVVTRVLRAVDNVILTWGSHSDRLPRPLMITLLYLAWIYPLMRLAANTFSISKYVMGYEGTAVEKSLPWKMRAADQFKRFWPDLVIDIFWVAIRGMGCFAYSFPTPQPLPVSLFGSRVVLEMASTAYTMKTYDELDGNELKSAVLKDRGITISIWSSYFLGALCGLINQFALAVGSLWIAATCIAQTVWELSIREAPMTLKVVNDQAIEVVSRELSVIDPSHKYNELPTPTM